MLQEAASGEQMSILQKELQQLHASVEHMKEHLEAGQQSQTNAQVADPCLAAGSVLSMFRSQVSSRLPAASLFFADRLSISFCFCLSCCSVIAYSQSWYSSLSGPASSPLCTFSPSHLVQDLVIPCTP